MSRDRDRQQAPRPIVGVMGSGTDPHEEKSGPLGRMLAEMGVHLLTGGGRGVMDAVSRSFFQTRPRVGRVIGVLPGLPLSETMATPQGYPNPWVEIPIRTHLGLSGKQGVEPGSRNHINVLTAHAVIALPGGFGTSSEVALARRYGKPVAAFVDHGADIPDLAPGTPVIRQLGEIRAFLEKVLMGGHLFRKREKGSLG